MGAGLGEGIGSLFSGYLEGRRARLDQQNIENNYALAKQKEAADESAKQYELETVRMGALGQYGSGGAEYMGSNPNLKYGGAQPSQPAPQGLMNPSAGFMGHQDQGSPASTVPSTNAQVNPPQPQQAPGQHLPSMFERQFIAGRYKDVQDKVNSVMEKGGKAHIDQRDPSNPQFVLDSLGPQADAEINNLKHGQRSAEGSINSQYNEDIPIKTAKGSQINMAQMIDNYNHPSPQGDASLVMNAFKIKFPNQATDVNSIEDLQKSQSVPDQWKAQMSKALNGQFDQSTRDNLMRDGISTYRANVQSMQKDQSKFSARAKNAGVDGSLIMNEPAVMGTYKDAMAMQDKLGPYQPPAQRSGLMNKMYGLVGNMVGAPASSTATANSTASGPPPGLSFEQFKAWKKQNAGQKK